MLASMPRSFRRRHSKKPLLTPPCTIVPRVLLQRCKLPKPGRSQRCQPISFPAVSPHGPPTVPWRSCRSERRRCSRSVSCMPSTQHLLVQATVNGSRGGQDRRVFDITILHLVLLSFQLFDPIKVVNTDDTESTVPAGGSRTTAESTAIWDAARKPCLTVEGADWHGFCSPSQRQREASHGRRQRLGSPGEPAVLSRRTISKYLDLGYL